MGKIPTARVARAIERSEMAGLLKVVVMVNTGQIMGAANLTPERGELVQIREFVMLVGAPYRHLKGAEYIHATLAEGLWTMMEEVKPVE
jgi:pyruvate/2-oxoglutarate dehydrogenase complex dihydrolipoamide dehydrogenase (E3) component